MPFPQNFRNSQQTWLLDLGIPKNGPGDSWCPSRYIHICCQHVLLLTLGSKLHHVVIWHWKPLKILKMNMKMLCPLHGQIWGDLRSSQGSSPGCSPVINWCYTLIPLFPLVPITMVVMLLVMSTKGMNSCHSFWTNRGGYFPKRHQLILVWDAPQWKTAVRELSRVDIKYNSWGLFSTIPLDWDIFTGKATWIEW